MQQEEWIGWIIRVVLASVVLGFLLVLGRWLMGNSRNWRELWRALASTVRRQACVLMFCSAMCFLVTLLLPMARFDAGLVGVIIRLLGVIWIALGAWAVSLSLSIVVGTMQWKYNVDVADNLLARRMHTKIRVLQRVVVVVIWVAAIAGMLMQFDSFRALGTTLLASAGVLSIVLGISAQKTFGSMIAGVQVALTHPINLDDVVIVEGEWGRIEEITFTYVVVKIWDQRRLIVPITYFLETPFQNWTRRNADITGSVFLHLDYDTPLESLRAEAQRLCKEAGPLWDGKTCVLQITEAGAETMTIRVLVSSSDASKAWDLRCLVREGLIDFVKANYPESLPKRRVAIQESRKADFPDEK
ncbi:mechanosensitive ion channel domain-containing protein [uncultured Pseudodesulfovibrio sp.]|uniref:mechanosensitive ion channel family protein n=1 Tax=uncultured Pseudodesulfovibrio sp. TaxID=2035858 RepID=UPI0029C89FAA|nr:mechanosensitive ion channel domain-containing protein [uncultured Pseudodesulfovibrio sp.]